MNRMCTAALAVAALLGGTAALAQAPAGVVRTPSQQQNPNASGGKAQAAGEMRADMRKMMDTNGDGMISRQEWDAYHAKMWGSMKANDKGMVSWADVEAGMQGGQGGTPK